MISEYRALSTVYKKTSGSTFWRSCVPLSAATPLAASNVVTDWNTIANTAIVKNGGKAAATSGVWFAYTSLAVYDAVNAITGQYRPFYYHGAAPQDASPESAAAAHRILVNYFPAQQTGSVSTLIAGYFGTTEAHVVVDSTAFQDGLHTHTFEDTRDLMDEVFWARIYAGVHYFHSLEDGRQLGTTIARELLRTHFGLQHASPDIRSEKDGTR